MPDAYPEAAAESAGIRDYIGIVRRQKWIVLGATTLALGLAGILVARSVPMFRATAVIRLADTRRALGGAAQSEAYDQVLGRDVDILQSQLQVLTSRGVIGEAVDSGGLRLVPLSGSAYPSEIRDLQIGDRSYSDSLHVEFGSTQYSVRSAAGTATAEYGRPISAGRAVRLVVESKPALASTDLALLSHDRAIRYVTENLKATPRPKTDVVDLMFVSSDPLHAKRVANVLALTFQARNASGAQQVSRRRRIFLENQLEQTNAMLQQAMNRYSSYRSGQRVFSSREKASAQQAGLVTVDMRRAELDAERRTFEALLAQTQRSGGGESGMRALISSPGVAANPVIQRLYVQLTTFEMARDSLKAAGGAPSNPDLIALNSLIESTNRRLVDAVKSQIQGLNASIASIDALRERSTAEIASSPAAETEETQLAQNVQTAQRLSDQLQEEFQQARMSEAVEAGQVEIVDLAEVPSSSLAGASSRKLALGMVLGLMLGVGAAILVDGNNRSIRKRSDIERLLQVPGLAVIPRFTSGNARFERAKLLGRGNGSSRAIGEREEGLVTIDNARSTEAEAFRTLRTNLIFSQSVKSLRTLVVSSAAPGEGKTTTAANLAVSYAQQGVRVVLVDCDLRKPRLHKVFGVTREPGITELVLGREAQDDVIRETETPGLYLVTSGQLPPNPSELLGGERMSQCLQGLSEACDLVILDSPPLLAASDGAILATICDGIVIVVRAGFTDAEAVQQAVQQLTTVGARVVGAVLNDPDAKLPSYGSYYNYDYAPAES